MLQGRIRWALPGYPVNYGYGPECVSDFGEKNVVALVSVRYGAI